MKKLSYILTMLLFCSGSLFAQKIEGERAKFEMLNELGGTIYNLSPNGRYYVIPGEDGVTGVLGDLEKGTYHITVTGSLEKVTNDGTCLGTTLHPTLKDANGPLKVAAIYKPTDSSWTILPNPAFTDPSIPDYNKYTVPYGISADGKTAVGMAYTKEKSGFPYCGILWQNGEFKKLLHSPYGYFCENPTHCGGRPNSISANGKVIPGFGVSKDASRAPAYWTVDDPDGFALAIDGIGEWMGGEAHVTNHDGGIIGGTFKGSATLWYLNNRNDSTVIPAPVGWNGTSITGISNDTTVIGFCQGMDIGNRAPFIWTAKNGLLMLDQYLYELYGLDLRKVDLFTPMGISQDGQTIVGWTMNSSGRVSYYIKLEDEKLHSRPIQASAKQTKNTMTVSVNWKTPLDCGRTIAGYNVYRDSIKINTDLITKLSYNDVNAPAKTVNYTATAVYADGKESAMSVPVKIQVVAPGGCYSIKYIHADLLYNRHAEIHWTTPSPEWLDQDPDPAQQSMAKDRKDEDQISEKSSLLMFGEDMIPMSKAPQLNNNKAMDFDLVYTRNLLSSSRYATIKRGDYYYVSDWQKTTITKFNDRWEELEDITIPKLPPVQSFAQVGDAVFVCAGNKYIYEIDIENKLIVNTIQINGIEFKGTTGVTRIAYIPTLDGGKGGFEIGYFTNSYLIDMEGNKLEDGFELPLVEGSDYFNTVGNAYLDGKIYFSTWIGENRAEILEYDVQTKKATGKKIDYFDYHQITDLASFGFSPGALNIIMLEDSTICLVANIQNEYLENFATFFEIKSNPNLIGYNLYQDGEKINSEPTKSRHYKTDLMEAGTYKYTVESVFKSGCTSEKSYEAELKTEPIGICGKVSNIKALEQNKAVNLTWEKEEQDLTSAELLGFNVFRDNQKLNDDFIVFFKYSDLDLEVGEYIYRVESFYDNSCVASDSIKINVTHKGVQGPPTHLKLSAAKVNDNNFKVDAAWAGPYFEEPSILRYGNGVSAKAVGLGEKAKASIAVGWDSTVLDNYRDYSVIGLELIIRDKTGDPILFVMVDEKIVQTLDYGRYEKDEYFTGIFKEPVSMKNAWEVVVGYTTDVTNPAAYPFSQDFGTAVKGYSDLICMGDPNDIKNWQALRDGSIWTLGALVARNRDIELAQKRNISLEKAGIIHKLDMNSAPVSNRSKDVQTFASPSPSIKLKGYNVYRDGEKLNTEILKELNFSESILEEGLFTYKIASLWNDDLQEVFSENKTITLANVSTDEDIFAKSIQVYPNPARGVLFIKGDYDKVRLMDLSGRVCKVAEKSQTKLSLDGLPAGIYMAGFEINGKTIYKKVSIL